MHTNTQSHAGCIYHAAVSEVPFPVGRRGDESPTLGKSSHSACLFSNCHDPDWRSSDTNQSFFFLLICPSLCKASASSSSFVKWQCSFKKDARIERQSQNKVLMDHSVDGSFVKRTLPVIMKLNIISVTLFVLGRKEHRK